MYLLVNVYFQKLFEKNKKIKQIVNAYKKNVEYEKRIYEVILYTAKASIDVRALHSYVKTKDMWTLWFQIERIHHVYATCTEWDRGDGSSATVKEELSS